ncbi:MAG: phytoene desaturase family protein [Treponemataceae bacterium]
MKANYDVIIIGAGLGGLTTGATLAKKGKKVLVLEQHFIPGGSATIFERKGIKCEVGLHEMDWGTKDTDMKGLVLKKLGLDTLPLVKLPEAWRIKTEKAEYTIPHGRKNVIKYLSDLFPEEKKGIKKYFSSMKWAIGVNQAFPNDLNPLQFLLFPILKLPAVIQNMIEKASVGQKFDKFFKSNELKNILNANIAYYSDDPYEFSWYYHSAAQYSYYNSAVYVKGGSQVLSNALAKIITDNGGEVRLNADVKKIEVEGKTAVGVSYMDKKSKEMVCEYGKKIVANCSPDSIFKGGMVSARFSEPKTENQKPASSLWTAYLISKQPISKKYPNMAYSTFIMDDKHIKQPQDEMGAMLTKKPIEERPFVLVDYSTIDAGLVPEGDNRGFAVACGVSNLDEWAVGISKEEYKAKKAAFIEQFLNRLEAMYPGFKENIEYSELSTPKTAARYLRTPNGTAYGYKNKGFSMLNRAPFKATNIKNLHFSGAWTSPGGGFTGAILGGYYTAVDMLMPMKWRIIIGTILCTISCTAISMGIKAFLGSH